ncbi:MAG: hypothetical protein JO069_10775 [Verrucomicrobia bacterium]|nr:hypothetical protein [Verrucomicrobiota bacterium]
MFLVFAGEGLPARANEDDFAEWAMKRRAEALCRISPDVIMHPSALSLAEAQISPSLRVSGPYPWKYGITTTVFWIGEKATPRNPVSNEKSAWDSDWVLRYGGYDNPDAAARVNFVPVGVVPGINPFYVALPYNDINDHHTKPEAALVIPWFRMTFVRDGESVCKGRWLAIRHGRRVCYAQWEDVGPFAVDHWQYVFGSERPRPNPNQDAGLDVSPAVRDFLGLSGDDRCDWKFVDFANVPLGPWSLYGDDNPFVRLRRLRSVLPAGKIVTRP